VSTTLQPREVDKPFLWRWSRMAFELVVRSPIRFGLIVALLGSLDTWAVNAAREYVIPRTLLVELGVGLLPALWTLVAALAHSADKSLGVQQTVAGLVRTAVWRGVLFAAAVLVGLKILEIGAVAALPQRFHDHNAFGTPGKFVSTFALYATFATLWLGSCYFPLLLRAPKASWTVLYHLSRRAAEMNDNIIVMTFVGCVVIFADSLSAVLPAYGMTMACFLVFLGVFNYVGYRDIFEGRARNAPVASAQHFAREPTHSVEPG
jgi:hypothetical protein